MEPGRTRDGEREGYIIPIGGAEEKVPDRGILASFIHLAGGKEARIAILPTASEHQDTGTRYERLFKEIGVSGARVFKLDTRDECEDAVTVGELQRASGVFLTGGNQLRLSTTLGGTKTAHALRDMCARGVHVAGTSAGAGFLSEHMIAFGDEGSTPRADIVTLAPGLGLTNSVIVDHHFRERDRIGRLITAIAYNPFVAGLGLDENTAVFIAPDDTLQVMGSGAVTIVDPSEVEHSSMDSAHRHDPICIVGLRLHVLTDGWCFDLHRRQSLRSENRAAS